MFVVCQQNCSMLTRVFCISIGDVWYVMPLHILCVPMCVVYGCVHCVYGVFVCSVEAGDLQCEAGEAGAGAGGGAPPEHHPGAPLEGFTHQL